MGRRPQSPLGASSQADDAQSLVAVQLEGPRGIAHRHGGRLGGRRPVKGCPWGQGPWEEQEVAGKGGLQGVSTKASVYPTGSSPVGMAFSYPELGRGPGKAPLHGSVPGCGCWGGGPPGEAVLLLKVVSAEAGC